MCVGAQLTTPLSIQGPLETNRAQTPKPCKNAAEICRPFPIGESIQAGSRELPRVENRIITWQMSLEEKMNGGGG